MPNRSKATILAQLDAVYGIVPIGLATLDADLRYTRVNDELIRLHEKLYGSIDRHLVGKHVREVLPDTVWKQVSVKYRAVLERREKIETTVEVPPRMPGDSRRMIIEAIYAPIIDDRDDRVVGINVVARDVTEQKQAERLLKMANAQMASARTLAERDKQEAERRSEAKDEFLAVLSHELRTPLTPVLAALQMVRAELGEAAGHEESLGIDAVKQALRMLSTAEQNLALEVRIIDDLLDIARITRGKLKVELQPTNVLEAICEQIDLFEPMARDKGLHLSADLCEASETEPLQVLADPLRLRQIIWNLLSNAVKFTPAGGHIRLGVAIDGTPVSKTAVSLALPDQTKPHARTVGAVSKSGSRPSLVSIVIEDDGIGIEPGFLEQMFDAFEQDETNPATEPSVRANKGLGLGLAICRQLALSHHGVLTAESRGRDQGTRFTFKLPRYFALREAPTAPAPPPPSSQPERKIRRLLLVEDNDDSAKVLAIFLRRRLRAKVDIASSIASAVKKMTDAVDRHEPYDAIVSDIGLPDASGCELLARYNAAAPGKDAPPAIALSGYGTDADIQRSLDAGFRDHLVKPVNLQLLERCVLSLLDDSLQTTSTH